MASIIKVDQLSEKTQGSGITLSHSLKNSSGSEIISSSGSIGSAVDFANIANDSISGDKIHGGTISSSTLDGIKLKSSGNSITKSDGTTSVLSESGGVVTLNNGTIGSGVKFPVGHVIKTVYSYFDDHFSTTTDADTGLSGTIDVSSSSNDVLIICSILWMANSNGGYFSLCLPDNTIINRPNQYSTYNLQGRHHWGTVYGSSSYLTYNSRRDTFSTIYSPNASGNLTIKLRAFCTGTTVFLNRNPYNDNRVYEPTGISTLILMEIQR